MTDRRKRLKCDICEKMRVSTTIFKGTRYCDKCLSKQMDDMDKQCAADYSPYVYGDLYPSYMGDIEPVVHTETKG